MSKAPEIRIKVTDMDKLMKLTWPQERVWMYYKRREGADGKAFGIKPEYAAVSNG
jgi:hypothetical protein